MDMISEELDVIRSIYCLPGECEVDGTGETTRLTLKLRPHNDERRSSPEMSVSFLIGQDYPNNIPQISIISAYLRRDQLSKIRQEVARRAQALQGQCMLADLISFAQEKLDEAHIDFPNETLAVGGYVSESADSWTALLHLDHMRAKNKYVKTIRNWTTELGLNGRLLFQGKLILILLQGPQSKIKDYITRQRSVTVDVDSRGRSCKERQMSILCEQKTSQHCKRFQEFHVIDCESADELQNVFTEIGLEEMFVKYVKCRQEFY